MKAFFPALLLSFVLSGTASTQEALKIANDFEMQKIASLEAYLQENPEAEDREMALRILVGSYTALGNFTAVPDLLLQRYELQPESAEPNLQVLLAEISRPLVEASISSDQRDKAKAFITRVKSDYEGTPQSSQINQLLDQLASDLYLPGVGDTMSFAFTDLEGNEVDLEMMKDKVILVDFWATWCGPCIASMPGLLAAYEEWHGKGFEVIGISLDENKAELETFIKENKIPWPQYFDALGGENEIAQRYGIRRIPATFLIGKGGKVTAANLHGDELTAAIAAQLGEAP